MARDNLYVVIVGAIDAAAAKAALDSMFGALPERAELTPVAEVTPAVGEVAHEDLNSPQTVIRLGGIGILRDDPDFIAAYVADQILGGGVFSSRLYTAVREDRGLAYSVGSGLLPYEHSGAFIAATSVDAANAGLAVDIMREEIERYATEGPTEQELARGAGLPGRQLRATLRLLAEDRAQPAAVPGRRPRHRLHRAPQRADPRRHHRGRAPRRRAHLGRRHVGRDRRPTARRAGGEPPQLDAARLTKRATRLMVKCRPSSQEGGRLLTSEPLEDLMEAEPRNDGAFADCIATLPRRLT